MFLWAFLFLKPIKKDINSQMSGEQFGSSAPKENLLPNCVERGSVSSSSLSEHLDLAKTSKQIYLTIKKLL